VSADARPIPNSETDTRAASKARDCVMETSRVCQVRRLDPEESHGAAIGCQTCYRTCQRELPSGGTTGFSKNRLQPKVDGSNANPAVHAPSCICWLVAGTSAFLDVESFSDGRVPLESRRAGGYRRKRTEYAGGMEAPCVCAVMLRIRSLSSGLRNPPSIGQVPLPPVSNATYSSSQTTAFKPSMPVEEPHSGRYIRHRATLSSQGRAAVHSVRLVSLAPSVFLS
jgi:hypothetical protein